jgi:hypothetical protein
VCSITATGELKLGVTILYTGHGFTAGKHVVVTFNGPSMTNETFAPQNLPMLIVKADGTFGPWDVTYSAGDAGDWTLAFDDGTCVAAIHQTVAAS